MRLPRLVAFAVALSALTAAIPARAALLIDIDKTTQRMTVSVDGNELFNWPVSTGASGYDTPSGEFKPFRMEKDHFSQEWDDAPMPFSIFFTQQGHAIHGSYHKSIGRPASHGCVRLEPKNARTLFGLVKQEKMANTRVVLRGEAPAVAAPPVAKQQPAQRDRDIARNYDNRYLDNDDDVASVPPRMRVTRDGYRVYTDGQRYFYYRDPPPYVAPRRYDNGPYYYYGR